MKVSIRRVSWPRVEILVLLHETAASNNLLCDKDRSSLETYDLISYFYCLLLVFFIALFLSSLAILVVAAIKSVHLSELEYTKLWQNTIEHSGICFDF